MFGFCIRYVDGRGLERLQILEVVRLPNNNNNNNNSDNNNNNNKCRPTEPSLTINPTS
jgi:hypothetical protein